MIKTKEKHSALFIGNPWVQNCEKRFQEAGGHQVSDSDWFQHIYKGRNTRGSSIAEIPETSSFKFVLFNDTLMGT